MKKESNPSNTLSPYMNSVHTWGRIWSIGALLVLLSVPTFICVKLGVWPEGAMVMKALA